MSIRRIDNHEIRVECVSKFHWLLLALSVEVFVDGKLVGRSPDELEGLSSTVRFEHSDSIKGTVKTCGFASAFRTRYEIEVNSQPSEFEVMVARNWWLTVAFMVPLIVTSVALVKAIIES